MIDPYSILGISRDASDEEVKKAYRKMSSDTGNCKPDEKRRLLHYFRYS